MILSTEAKRALIEQELQARQQLVKDRCDLDRKIQALISEHCELVPGAAISREQWQDFCFQVIFQRDCHTNIPFCIYLNQLMPELGFPLGYVHNKVRVYRGLQWKAK